MRSVAEGQVTIELAEGVFYNPRMEMGRDITVAVLACLPAAKTCVDAMAASGIRGIRLKKEVPRELEVTVNDWDAPACELIRRNAALNGVAVDVTNRGANTLLSSTRFDFVDLDPFGTPAPYVDAACRSAKVGLGVTATDTAPLCGAHLKAGMRRYGSRPLKTEYYPEVGLRTLLGTVAREEAKYDRGLKPLLCHATEHYVRLYLQVQHGVADADRTVSHLGFLLHCPHCLYRECLHGLAAAGPARCPVCGRPALFGGPLWLGPTKDNAFAAAVAQTIAMGAFRKKERALRLLDRVMAEIDVPTFYDQHRLCQDLRATPTPIGVLIDDLRSRGFLASRAHYSGIGFKTNAPINEIKSTILRLSPVRGG